ncbi:MAG: hypothetical protein A2096_05575 [Spirochaetes bacterium GWF1_41_5]|nr:MAG: hypothetical protein A2096_05575 [Spirochaetes bacterium GWF1_41_5]
MFLKKIQLKSNNKKLSFSIFSLFILFIADLFLISLIFYGLNEQINQLTNPFEYFPYKYKKIFIEDKWVENNIIYNIMIEVLDSDTVFNNKKKHKQKHDVCKSFDKIIINIRNKKELFDDFKKYRNLITQFGGFDKYEKKRGFADNIYNEIQLMENIIKHKQEITELISFINKYQNYNFESDIKKYKKIYALKRTALGFIFLLPLILLVILWNRKAFLKESEIQIIISSHFLIVSLIPVIFEICRLIYEVLPRVILKTIYDFLIQSKLVAIWYYILILLCTVIIIFIIWFLQQKVFTIKRFLIKRILSNRCSQCGIKVDYSKNFCPNCNNQLRKKCENCNEMKIKDFDYCSNCGKKN